DAVLAENDRGRGLAHFLDLGADLLDTVDKLALVRGKCCHGLSFARSWGLEDYRAKGLSRKKHFAGQFGHNPVWSGQVPPGSGGARIGGRRRPKTCLTRTKETFSYHLKRFAAKGVPLHCQTLIFAGISGSK